MANSEMEGSLAVGGSVTFGVPGDATSTDYKISHRIAGNGDYNVPTIDGAPNRLLIQRYDNAGQRIGHVATDGASGSNATAGAIVADQTTPSNYLVRAGWGSMPTAYAPKDGTNQSPQVASDVQPNTDEGRASWNLSGTVLGQFPEDKGTEILSSYTGWLPVDAPSGNDAVIKLSPAGPSKLPLSAFSTTPKFTLEGYSDHSFLVIKVSPTDVVEGKLLLPSYSQPSSDPTGNAGIQHLLFDLSEISSDVTLTTAQSVPLRGAVYAPKAHVTFAQDGPQFEGQIIAKDFSALQGGVEIHTSLFGGSFPCLVDTGTFTMKKVLDGIEPADFPDGTTFPVTATWGDGADETQTFNLPADGTAVTGVDLPIGTKVTFTEGDLPPAPDGYEFVSSGMEPESVTIDSSDTPVAWTITNTYEATPTGTFTMHKVLDGIEPADFPDGTTFPVTATWGTEEGTSKQFNLPADGSVVDSGIDLPIGTKVTFTEGDLPPAPEGYEFVSSSMSPETVTIGAGEDPVAWTITNTYKATPPIPTTGTFTMQKVLDGVTSADFPDGATFPVTATWGDESHVYQLPADGSIVEAGVSLPTGTVVTFTEGDLPPAPDGYTFTSHGMSAESITIGDGTTSKWTITNTYAATDSPGLGGGFDLSKELSGITPDRFPLDTTFTVTASWDVDGEHVTQDYELPADGSVVEGARDLPAGTVVTFSEARPNDPYGYAFVSVSYSAEQVTIASGENPTVVVTNTYAPSGGLPATGAGSPAAIAGWTALALVVTAVGALAWRRRSARS